MNGGTCLLGWISQNITPNKKEKDKRNDFAWRILEPLRLFVIVTLFSWEFREKMCLILISVMHLDVLILRLYFLLLLFYNKLLLKSAQGQGYVPLYEV